MRKNVSNGYLSPVSLYAELLLQSENGQSIEYIFFFRKCNNEQEIYHEFSSKVEETAYQATKLVLRKLYPKCSTDEAWTVDNISVYEECTSEISASNTRIQSTLPKIKEFVYANNLSMSIQAQLTQLMEDVELNPYKNDGLEVAIAYIKQTSSSNSPFKTCSEVQGCLESTRKVVVQLKMIEWRLFGIGQATAGVYLAYHYSKLGPYYGDLEGRNPKSHH